MKVKSLSAFLLPLGPPPLRPPFSPSAPLLPLGPLAHRVADEGGADEDQHAEDDHDLGAVRGEEGEGGGGLRQSAGGKGGGLRRHIATIVLVAHLEHC